MLRCLADPTWTAKVRNIMALRAPLEVLGHYLTYCRGPGTTQLQQPPLSAPVNIYTFNLYTGFTSRKILSSKPNLLTSIISSSLQRLEARR